MYNMFLGIRAATQATDLGCAQAVLGATRTGATAWNTSHEDPDIAADLMLVDQYLANITAHGGGEYGGAGSGGRPIASCPTAIGPDGPPVTGQPVPIGESDDHYNGMVCSSGGATGGLPVLFGALAAVGLRRRRRR
jgi:MYXO-CTERM domain-containing protein